MYFANMYCYGHDNDIVGITGIRGCMGVIYKGGGTMVAVHIPHNSNELNALGGQDFARHVRTQLQQVGKGHGELLVFINGQNRPDAAAEALAIKKLLKNPRTTVYRINKHLGPESGKFGADSVVTMVEHVHSSATNPSGTAIWFKRNDAITWAAGGKAEAGQYKVDPRYLGAFVPSNLNAQWWRVNSDNSTAIQV